MDTLPTLYKIVGPNGEPLNGGTGYWPLPTATEPGAWRAVDGPVVPCHNGLHLTDEAHADMWNSPGSVIYRAEYRGEIVNAGDKYAAREVRLLPGTFRLGPADPIAAEAARVRCETATVRYVKRERRAGRKLSVKVPPQWAAYLRAVGTVTLSPAHPARAYQDALNAAQAAYEAEERAARKALDPIEAAYNAAIAPVLVAE